MNKTLPPPKASRAKTQNASTPRSIQPIGTIEVIQAILNHCQKKEWRKPKARKPEDDEPGIECPCCLGDGQDWSTEDQAWMDCGRCGGKGELPWNHETDVFMHVWRDFHSLECLVHIKNGKAVDAVATVKEGDYQAGQLIDLTPEEVSEAERIANE